MQKERDPYLHCYNLEQARFFKDCGVPIVDFDFSTQNKKVFFLFERGEVLDRAFELWRNKNKK
jgi:hypothetical protein